jgi:hypothetical protein
MNLIQGGRQDDGNVPFGVLEILAGRNRVEISAFVLAPNVVRTAAVAAAAVRSCSCHGVLFLPAKQNLERQEGATT